MMKLKLLGAAAILSTALVTPLMAQEATQEPGMIGLNYPNSDLADTAFACRTSGNATVLAIMPPGRITALAMLAGRPGWRPEWSEAPS